MSFSESGAHNAPTMEFEVEAAPPTDKLEGEKLKEYQRSIGVKVEDEYVTNKLNPDLAANFEAQVASEEQKS